MLEGSITSPKGRDDTDVLRALKWNRDRKRLRIFRVSAWDTAGENRAVRQLYRSGLRRSRTLTAWSVCWHFWRSLSIFDNVGNAVWPPYSAAGTMRLRSVPITGMIISRAFT